VDALRRADGHRGIELALNLRDQRGPVAAQVKRWGRGGGGGGRGPDREEAA
jgi:hypothetical protein